MTVATRPKQTPGYSIIDLTLTTSDLGLLPSWIIDPDYSTQSDHELISFDIENLDNKIGSMGPSSEVTGWAIKEINDDQERAAKIMWNQLSGQRPLVNEGSNYLDLDGEAQWISDTFTTVLDQHFRKLRVCARSKRWWSQDISESRSRFKAIRRQFQRQLIPIEVYKEERNTYYRKIRKARDQCFENWIQGEEETYEPTCQNLLPENTQLCRQIRNEENERCWKALQYTKEWTVNVTPALRGQDGAIAVTVEEKEEMVRAMNFPSPPMDDRPLPEKTLGSAYTKVCRNRV